MENNKEYVRRLNWIANRLKCDLIDLLDWYKNDNEDIVYMDGKRLIAIVKEYIKLRSYYRQST